MEELQRATAQVGESVDQKSIERERKAGRKPLVVSFGHSFQEGVDLQAGRQPENAQIRWDAVDLLVLFERF